MALIHHPVLGVESDVPGRTVHIWRRSGWLLGPLPQPIADLPVDESTVPSWDNSTNPPQED